MSISLIRYYPRSPSKLTTKIPIKRMINIFCLREKENPLYILDNLRIEAPDPIVSEYGWNHYNTCAAECVKWDIIYHNEHTLETKLNMIKQFFKSCDRLKLLAISYYNLIGGKLMSGECEFTGLEGACQHYKDETIRLKKALKRINDSIIKTGTNSIGMNMSVFELKGIVETALGEEEET